MTPLTIGILGLIALFLLLIASLPVAFVMTVVGVVGFAAITSMKAALALLAYDFHNTFTNYGLSVIPLFVLMGQICFHSGISTKLFATANKWMGALPGGLAIATIGACTIFSAICGSGPATAATMAAVAIPEMRKRGYSHELAAGTVAAGGSLGMLIPPSVVFIVYGILTELSIGKLFISGILPGILIALLFSAAIIIKCLLNPELAPKQPKCSLREKLTSLKGVIQTVALFLVVIIGMSIGLFTPTEGAAIGAAGSIIIAAIEKKLSFKMLSRALEETIRTSCMVMVIVAGATVFGHFLSVTGIPTGLAEWLSQLPLPAWIVMMIIGLFYLVAGCFIDSLALIMLTVPIFYPVILKLGYNPIWFGTFIVIISQMGVLTPPVGVNVFVVSGIDKSIPIQKIFRGAMPFLFALFLAVALILIFPEIVTYLPSSVK